MSDQFCTPKPEEVAPTQLAVFIADLSVLLKPFPLDWQM